MKILVALKQVVDPEHASELRVSPDRSQLYGSGLEQVTNPFDEYALEAALRLTEAGTSSKARFGRVVAVTLGDPASEIVLRGALALGAESAIRVEAHDDTLDASIAAKAIAALARDTSADLVLLGKQSVDGDGAEVAQRVASILQWPQATSCIEIIERAEGNLLVKRAVDGGVLALALRLPAVLSVDLRIIAQNAVRSRHCLREPAYPESVRYASLPAIVAAKRKPIPVLALSELAPSASKHVEYVAYDTPVPRGACKRLASVDELVAALRRDAEVLKRPQSS